jgi:hypothetical protein
MNKGIAGEEAVYANRREGHWFVAARHRDPRTPAVVARLRGPSSRRSAARRPRPPEASFGVHGGKKASERASSRPYELELGEVVEGSWIAGIPFERFGGGRLTRTGGTLILTNRRLLFEPLKLPAAGSHGLVTLLKLLANLGRGDVPVSDIGTHGIGTALELLVNLDRGGVPLSDISHVEAMPGKLPHLRIVSKAGDAAVFFVAERRTATPWGRQNYDARDDAMRRITTALERVVR